MNRCGNGILSKVASPSPPRPHGVSFQPTLTSSQLKLRGVFYACKNFMTILTSGMRNFKYG
eukprot:5354556-Amphidinium_carterae.1